MPLRLSRRAQADLDGVRDYSVEQFGVERAIGYLDAIERAFGLIVRHPEIGAARSSLGDRVRSMASGEHRIFYLPDGSGVLVLRVLHKRMDAGRHV